jgi:hypothetical protein
MWLVVDWYSWDLALPQHLELVANYLQVVLWLRVVLWL